MSIKNRLIAIMIVAMIGFSTVFLVATLGLEKLGDRISEIGEEKIPQALIAEEIIAGSLAFQRDILRLILVQDASRQERIRKRILETRASISKLNEALRTLATSADTIALLDEMKEFRKATAKMNDQIMELHSKNQKDQAIEIATGLEYRDTYEAYIVKMKALIELEKDRVKQSVMLGKAESSSAKIWILIISGVVLLVLVVFSVFVIQSITQAVKQVVTAVSQVTQTATFNTRLPTREDELNDISTNLNHLLVGLEKAITESNQVVNSIANADFTQRMNGNYVGDLEKLKQGVNGSANSVSFMMGELEKVMNGLNAGQFDVHMDQKVPQAFRTLVETALNSLSQVVTDISQVMTQMTAGHFDGRVTSNASGELLTMKNNINTSMDAVAHAIRAISEVVSAQAQGDLTKTLPSATFKGQLQELTNAINYSANKVKQTVIQSVEVSNVVNEAAAQVSQGSTDLSGRVQEQAAALEQTSATMNEMAIAVQTNTANAHKVSELAHQVRHQTTAGVEVMQKTISAMQSIKASSSQIADIVTLIDGIAFQTNLLALNAAVEAARAGEHGRGFAVVAGEVRALAQKSASAAKDIKDLITESVHRIEVGTQLADKSGEMLNGITDSIGQVASMVEQIASASSEQSDGIHQVHRAIANIDKVTQENAALVEETTSSAESLSVEAHNLKENMSFFKTGHA